MSIWVNHILRDNALRAVNGVRKIELPLTHGLRNNSQWRQKNRATPRTGQEYI